MPVKLYLIKNAEGIHKVEDLKCYVTVFYMWLKDLRTEGLLKSVINYLTEFLLSYLLLVLAYWENFMCFASLNASLKEKEYSLC